MQTKSVVIILFFAKLIFAQNITVFDAWTFDELPGCKIILKSDTLITDENGICRPDNHFIGKAIWIVKTGYYTAKVEIPKQNDFKIYLQPEEFTDAITVYPNTPLQPIILPTSVKHISITKNKKSRYLSIDRILKNETGIVFKSYGGDGQIQNIALRGLTAEQTQVLYDDIPLNSLQLGALDFGSIGTASLYTITVFKGGNPLFGGNGAIGGTINLQPIQTGKGLTLAIAGQANSIENFGTHIIAGFPVKNLHQSFSLSLNEGQNNYSVKSAGKTVRLKNRDYRSRSFFWQGTYHFNESSKINFLINNYFFKGGSPNPFTGEIAEQENNPRRSNDNTLVRIKFKKTTGNGHISSQIYQRNEWNAYKSPAVNSLHFNKETGFQLKAKWAFFNRLLLNTGFEMAFPAIKSSEAGKRERDRYSLFVVNDYQLYEDTQNRFTLNLNAAARIEKNDHHKNFLPGAGLNMRYDKTSWYISVTKNFRAPTFNELYWPQLGNLHLQPEKALTFESGLNYKNNLDLASFSTSLVYYNTVVKNQIRWLPDLANIAEVTTSGIEFNNTLGLWNDALTLIANYTLTRAQKTKAETENDRTVGNRIPYIPLHKINLAIQFSGTLFSSGIELDFQSYRYRTLANDINTILPSVGILSFWIGHTFKLSSELSTDINLYAENLTNKNYELYSGYPMPPRHYKLNLSLKYHD